MKALIRNLVTWAFDGKLLVSRASLEHDAAGIDKLANN